MPYWYAWQPDLQDDISECTLETKKKALIVDLPREWWPQDLFVQRRASRDGAWYEVLTDPKSWLPEWQQIWKFYPPEKSSNIVEETKKLIGIEPFSKDTDLQKYVYSVRNFATQSWVIDDGFLDHRQRRDFYERYPSISNYCRSISKLSGNNMVDLWNAVHMINAALSIPFETPLDNLNTQITGYDTLDFSGKKIFVGSIDRDILKYLKALRQHINPDTPTLQ